VDTSASSYRVTDFLRARFKTPSVAP
jgi:hypothetical protein